MATPKQRFAFTALIAAGLVLIVLFGGAGVTAFAAQSALPGDALYTVKTGLESTQASLTGDAAGQTLMHLNFAQRRLDEISSLVEEKRFAAVNSTAAEFQQQIKNAAIDLQQVSKNDPVRASQLAEQMTATVARSLQVLNNIQSNLPDTARPAIQNAIQASQNPGSLVEQESEVEFKGTVEAITPDHWIVGGQTVVITSTTQIEQNIQVGSTVEVKALKAADGSLTALSIQLDEAPAVTEVASTETPDDKESDDDKDEVSATQVVTNTTVITGTVNEDHQGDENNQDQGEEVEFSGKVDAISANAITVSGQVFTISAQSAIDSGIQVGSLVEIKAIRAADGSLTATRVKLAEQHDENSTVQPEPKDNEDNQGEDHSGSTTIKPMETENGDRSENSTPAPDSSSKENDSQDQNDSHSGDSGLIIGYTIYM